MICQEVHVLSHTQYSITDGTRAVLQRHLLHLGHRVLTMRGCPGYWHADTFFFEIAPKPMCPETSNNVQECSIMYLHCPMFVGKNWNFYHAVSVDIVLLQLEPGACWNDNCVRSNHGATQVWRNAAGEVMLVKLPLLCQLLLHGVFFFCVCCSWYRWRWPTVSSSCFLSLHSSCKHCKAVVSLCLVYCRHYNRSNHKWRCLSSHRRKQLEWACWEALP